MPGREVIQERCQNARDAVVVTPNEQTQEQQTPVHAAATEQSMTRGQGSDKGAIKAATLGAGEAFEDGPGDDLGVPVVQVGLQAVTKGVQQGARRLQPA